MTVYNPKTHPVLFLSSNSNITNFADFFSNAQAIWGLDLTMSALNSAGIFGSVIQDNAPTDINNMWIDPNDPPEGAASIVKIYDTTSGSWLPASKELFAQLVGRIGGYSGVGGVAAASSVDVANLVTLSGIATNSQTLGTFIGTTLSDNLTVKAALQELEVVYETSTFAPRAFDCTFSQSLAASTPTLITSTTIVDEDLVTSSFVGGILSVGAGEDGWWTLQAHSEKNDRRECQVEILVNGVPRASTNAGSQNATYDTDQSVTKIVKLAVGDSVQLRIDQCAGTDPDIITGSFAGLKA